MVSFKTDYAEGAHPRILEALSSTNLEQAEGYGEDQFVQMAVDRIQAMLDTPCTIYFLSGGTQVNLALISHVLRQHQAVIAPDTGHIAVNETGAVEATGHKVITAGAENGKLTPKMVLDALNAHNSKAPHLVQPKLVYISQSTEIGTIYTKEELAVLYQVCQDNDLLLYVDGARLASALAAMGDGLTMADMARYTDAFSIGGTKCGALLGEGLVISNDWIAKDFRYTMKQKGALMAKGRVLGVQFAELFRDNLYIEVGAHANAMAMLLRGLLEEAGCRFTIDSVSNQQFVALPNRAIEELSKAYGFHTWGKVDDTTTAIRLVTSWATKEEHVRQFAADVVKLLGK